MAQEKGIKVSNSKVSKPRKNKVSRDSRTTAADADAALQNGLLKKLAHNDRPVREEALKTVTRYVSSKRSLDALQMQKLWKGMFYTMWHSDRPLTQQLLARDLAGIVASVQDSNFWIFIDAFWAIMIREWETLDSHRINKFYMLVRFYLKAIFTRLAQRGWIDDDLVELRRSMLQGGPLDPTSMKHPHSLRLHVIDVYLDELDAVFGEQGSRPDGEIVTLIIAPVLVQLEICDFKLVKKRVAEDFITDKRIFEWGALPAESDESSDNGEDEEDWEGFD